MGLLLVSPSGTDFQQRGLLASFVTASATSLT